MSAPKNAITLEEEVIEPPNWSFKCACGCIGDARELLVDPSGEDETMWCPICRTAAWIWE